MKISCLKRTKIVTRATELSVVMCRSMLFILTLSAFALLTYKEDGEEMTEDERLKRKEKYKTNKK